MRKQNYVQAVRKDNKYGCWTIPENEIWNLPEEDVPFDFQNMGTWVMKLRGIAVSAEFGDFSRMHNLRIYGPRTLQDIKEAGYHSEGRVSIGGKNHSAFTSSILFEREDGLLVNVGVLFARMP